MSKLVRDVGTLVEFAPTELPDGIRDIASDDEVQLPSTSVEPARNQNTDRNEQNFKSETDSEGRQSQRQHRDDTDARHSTGIFVVPGTSSGVGEVQMDLWRRAHNADPRLCRRPTICGGLLPTEMDLLGICELFYAILLTVLGNVLAATAFIIHATYSNEHAFNLLHGYFIFIFLCGVVLQMTLLIVRVCSAWKTHDAGSPRRARLPHRRRIGLRSHRIVVAGLGLLTSVAIVFVFAWRMQQARTAQQLTDLDSNCPDLRIEVTVLSLAFIYSLLHSYVLYFNVSLFVPRFDSYIFAALIQLFATDASVWAWTAVYFGRLLLPPKVPAATINPLIITTAPLRPTSPPTSCTPSTSLSEPVLTMAPYLVSLVVVYFWSAAYLTFALILAFRQRPRPLTPSIYPTALPAQGPAFGNNSYPIDTRQMDFYHKISKDRPCRQPRWPCTILSLFPGQLCFALLVIGAVTLVVCHVVLADSGGRNQLPEAWFLLESFASATGLLAILFCTVLVRIQYLYLDAARLARAYRRRLRNRPPIDVSRGDIGINNKHSNSDNINNNNNTNINNNESESNSEFPGGTSNVKTAESIAITHDRHSRNATLENATHMQSSIGFTPSIARSIDPGMSFALPYERPTAVAFILFLSFSFIGFAAYSVSYIVASALYKSHVSIWGAAGTILVLIEGFIQSLTLIGFQITSICSMRGPKANFRLTQTAIIVLSGYNIVCLAVELLRQHPHIYGGPFGLFARAFGTPYDIFCRIFLHNCSISYRLLSAVAFLDVFIESLNE